MGYRISSQRLLKPVIKMLFFYEKYVPLPQPPPKKEKKMTTKKRSFSYIVNVLDSSA